MNRINPSATALYFSLVGISKPGNMRLRTTRRRIIERTGFRNKTSIARYLRLLVKHGWITKTICVKRDETTNKITRRLLLIRFLAPRRWPEPYPANTPARRWLRLIDQVCTHPAVRKFNREKVRVLFDWMCTNEFPIPHVKRDAFHKTNRRHPLSLDIENARHSVVIGSGPDYRKNALKTDVFVGISKGLSRQAGIEWIEVFELSTKLANTWKEELGFVFERESNFTG